MEGGVGQSGEGLLAAVVDELLDGGPGTGRGEDVAYLLNGPPVEVRSAPTKGRTT